LKMAKIGLYVFVEFYLAEYGLVEVGGERFNRDITSNLCQN